jgi:hypothetical protein
LGWDVRGALVVVLLFEFLSSRKNEQGKHVKTPKKIMKIWKDLHETKKGFSNYLENPFNMLVMNVKKSG